MVSPMESTFFSISNKPSSDTHLNVSLGDPSLSHCNSERGKRLHLAQINARSLLPKISVITDIIHLYNIDILVISETWLRPDVPDSAILIKDFNLERADRKSHKVTRGGGVAIYIKDDLSYESVYNNQTPFLTDVPDDIPVDLCLVILKFKKTGLAIIGVYRSPNVALSWESDLEEALTHAICESNHMVCLGDFNINAADISHTCWPRLLHISRSLSLRQVIKEPTRSDSILDLIFVSDDLLLLDSGVAKLSREFDHDLIFCDINLDLSTRPSVYRVGRDFKRVDQTAFNEAASQADWASILNLSSLDEKVDRFSQITLNLINRFCPLRRFRIARPRPPWFSDNVKIIARARDIARSKWRTSKTVIDRDKYVLLRNFATSSLRCEKSVYLSSLSDRPSSKHMWEKVNLASVWSGQRQFSWGDLPMDPTSNNDFFIDTIPSAVASETLIRDLQSSASNISPNSQNTFVFKEIDLSYLCHAMKSFTSTATASDGINTSSVYLCVPSCLPALLNITNTSLRQAKFPSA
ncbi:uncharacterized protein LOC117181142 [Belonocnema kinseyi]|uniref:uncharacterized protein LOC117181142 n=1 Tax=Belonocnema kinseyi TaxID=2817044 RepID=UPI00143DE646|nr:uncharacterized protein LOC117181142 [Belonocnema kinseyi]